MGSTNGESGRGPSITRAIAALVLSLVLLPLAKGVLFVSGTFLLPVSVASLLSWGRRGANEPSHAPPESITIGGDTLDARAYVTTKRAALWSRLYPAGMAVAGVLVAIGGDRDSRVWANGDYQNLHLAGAMLAVVALTYTVWRVGRPGWGYLALTSRGLRTDRLRGSIFVPWSSIAEIRRPTDATIILRFSSRAGVRLSPYPLVMGKITSLNGKLQAQRIFGPYDVLLPVGSLAADATAVEHEIRDGLEGSKDEPG
jgi:hypothetical protein